MSCDHGATLERHCDGCFDTLRDQLAAANERRKAGNCPSCGWAGGHSNACGTITDAERRGYAACTADVVAFLAQLPAANIRSWIEAGEHVGAAGKVKP